MRRLKLARRGLSLYEANRGRLITFEDDVLCIRSQIETRWPELEVFFDEWTEEWVVVEHCKDVDRLATKVKVLDHNLIHRLEAADQHRAGHDIEKEVDDWNARLERERDRRLSDQLTEFAERFSFALRKDGFFAHEHISNCVGNRVNRKRVINR